MQSAEGQFLQVKPLKFLGIGLEFARGLVGPAAHAVVIVKEEVTLCLALLDEYRRQGIVLDVIVVESLQVQRTDDIGVVH